MPRVTSKYELPKNIERYLAVLSKLYAREGQRQKQEILVNSQVRVHEVWSHDNWNGGTYGHALYLNLPEALYLGIVRSKDDLQNQIKEDINKVHHVQNEFIEEVFLEMQALEDEDWRKESGLLVAGKRVVARDAEMRLWGDDGFRVFLSHKTEVKKQTAELKKRLQQFGVSSFVAHEDIHPTQEWQNEIENALDSMDALVALMTENFHDSLWTDQEVGFAFGRGVPIVSVKLGKDPYGFIGKFQALSCSWDNAAKEIVRILIKHSRMLNAYIRVVQNCRSWDQGNLLAEVLPSIEKLSDEQVNQFVEAYNENSEVRGSFGFNGTKPNYYGPGLVAHLSRITGRAYRELPSGKIKVKA